MKIETTWCFESIINNPLSTHKPPQHFLLFKQTKIPVFQIFLIPQPMSNSTGVFQQCYCFVGCLWCKFSIKLMYLSSLPITLLTHYMLVESMKACNLLPSQGSSNRTQMEVKICDEGWYIKGWHGPGVSLTMKRIRSYYSTISCRKFQYFKLLCDTWQMLFHLVNGLDLSFMQKSEAD